MASPVKVFISYAHKDEEYKNKLVTHLIPLEREGLIDSWNDRELKVGDNWDIQIKRSLEEAQIVLLLVSPDFISSDYIHRVEIQGALERHQEGKATISPIIIRTIDWDSFSLGRFQALPTGGKPISTWVDQDAAWVDVTKGLRILIRGLNKEDVPTHSIPNMETSQSSATQANTNTTVDQLQSSDLEQALEHVSNARIKEALAIVRKVVKEKDPFRENELISLSGRFNQLVNNERNGLLLPQQASIQRNQITHALIGLIQELRTS